MTYLEDGRCSLSNNLSENSIRPFTVGRKNWLFSDTPKGAEASATVYTMVEMARAHGLNIYKYLKYLLELWMAPACPSSPASLTAAIFFHLRYNYSVALLTAGTEECLG